MNDLQKIEFDLFHCFADICEKLDLNYFLVCGSALGAIRHGGVIPWDDDFDVGMYRDDYNKFMEFAPVMLPEGVFLQNYKSDPGYPLIFAKLRNSNTTFIEPLLAHFNMHHGVWMDIFPLDGYPEDTAEQKKLARMKRIYLRRSRCGYIMERPLKGKLYASILRFFGYDKKTDQTLAKYEALISSYPVKGSKIICNHGTWYGMRDYIAAEYYGKGTTAMYEGVEVRVPEDPDGYLTALYGDWRTPPSVEKQKPSHPCVVCDIEKPYTEYINKKLNGKI